MAKRKAISKAVRDKLLVDAMHRCCLCPEHPDVTDVHHIVPISEDGPDTVDNLMVVCPTCHAKIHRIRGRYTPEQLRMYKERWGQLCALGLPLDVRMAQAYDHTRPPKVRREEETEGVITLSSSPLPPNPFTPLSGRISDPSRVYDRDREIARALEILRASSSVALIGPAGVGKSSLLTKLGDLVPQRLGPAWEVVYLNLQIVHDEEELYDALCSSLDISTCRGYALARVLEGRRVLLCLDEIERMGWEGFTRGLRAELRGLAEGGNAPLKLALAARTSLDRLFPDSEGMTSPLANICLQVEVNPWDTGTAQDFILSWLRGTGVCFVEEEVTRLVAESGGHPRRLMTLCYEAYGRMSNAPCNTSLMHLPFHPM